MAKISPLLLAVAIYTAMTIILTSPMILHLGEWMPPGDQSLIAWIMAWDVHALTTDPLNLFNANAFYPYNHNSLAFSETFVGAAIFAAPILLLTNNPALAFNVIWMLSFIASAAGAYLLAKRFTGDEAASLVAGAIYGFCAFRFGHIGHLQLLIACWIPLSLLAFDMCLRTRRPRDFALLYVFLSLQALTCIYYAYYLIIAMLLYAAYVMAKEPEIRKIAATDRSFQLKAVATGIALLLTLSPFIAAYLDVRNTYGFERSEGDIVAYSADIVDFLITPTRNILYGWICPIVTTPLAVSEHSLFPGILTIILSSACVIWFLRKDKTVAKAAFFLVMAIVSLTLMAGSGIHFFGNVADMPMPYEMLYAFIPGFNAMRVPARLDILLILSLSILAAFGLHRLTAKVTPEQRSVIIAACLFIVMLEALQTPLSMETVPAPDDIPDVYKWLAKQDGQVPVIELPAGHLEPKNTLWINSRYMYYSTYHWKPIFNGYSGFFPPGYYETVDMLETFPSNESIDALRQNNLTYVIVHMGKYTRQEQDLINDGIKVRKDLLPVATFGYDSVYRILPENMDVPLTDLMLTAVNMPDTIQANGTYRCSLRITNMGDTDYYSVAGKMAYVSAFLNDDNKSMLFNASCALPSAIRSGSFADVSFSMQAPPDSGNYDIQTIIDVPSWGRTNSYTSHLKIAGDVPDIRSASDFKATLYGYDVPEIATNGSIMTVSLDVSNAGDAAWKTWSDNGSAGIVKLGVIWTSDIGEEESRIKIPFDVAPGQRVLLGGTIKVPDTPGNYSLTLWPVVDGLAWADLVMTGRPGISVSVL